MGDIIDIPIAVKGIEDIGVADHLSRGAREVGSSIGTIEDLEPSQSSRRKGRDCSNQVSASTVRVI